MYGTLAVCRFTSRDTRLLMSHTSKSHSKRNTTVIKNICTCMPSVSYNLPLKRSNHEKHKNFYNKNDTI